MITALTISLVVTVSTAVTSPTEETKPILQTDIPVFGNLIGQHISNPHLSTKPHPDNPTVKSVRLFFDATQGGTCYLTPELHTTNEYITKLVTRVNANPYKGMKQTIWRDWLMHDLKKGSEKRPKSVHLITSNNIPITMSCVEEKNPSKQLPDYVITLEITPPDFYIATHPDLDRRIASQLKRYRIVPGTPYNAATAILGEPLTKLANGNESIYQWNAIKVIRGRPHKTDDLIIEAVFTNQKAVSSKIKRQD